MQRKAFRQIALIGLAFLVITPHGTLAAVSFRDDAVAYRAKGYAAQQRGDRSEAFSWYQKAAALDPAYPDPQNDLGVVLEEEGRLDEARRAYQRAIELNPNFAEAHSNLALLSERIGDKEQAVTHWLKRYQLGQPDDLWTLRAKQHLTALGALIKLPAPASAVPAPPTVPQPPEAGTGMSPWSHLAHQEFKNHEQSRSEFNAVTEEHRDWSTFKFRNTR